MPIDPNGLTPGQREAYADVLASRASMTRGYATLMRASDLSTHGQWAAVATAAVEAGLSKEEILEAMCFSWSTMLRWQAGHVMPGPFARVAVRDRLATMVEERASALAKQASGLGARVQTP